MNGLPAPERFVDDEILETIYSVDADDAAWYVEQPGTRLLGR